jgi:hypothetical protein
MSAPAHHKAITLAQMKVAPWNTRAKVNQPIGQIMQLERAALICETDVTTGCIPADTVHIVKAQRVSHHDDGMVRIQEYAIRTESQLQPCACYWHWRLVKRRVRA